MKPMVWLRHGQQTVAYLKRHLWLSAVLIGLVGLMAAVGAGADNLPNPEDSTNPAAERYLRQSDQPQAYVTSWQLNMRQGPGLDYDIIIKLQNGQITDLLGRNGDGSWVKVGIPDSYVGWVYTQYIQSNVPIVNLPMLVETTAVAHPIDPNYQHTVYVTSPRLNVRGGPGTSFSIVAKLQRDESVTALGHTDNKSWLFVRLPNGSEGWIWREYTSTEPPAATLPLIYPVNYMPQLTSWLEGDLYLVQSRARRLNLRSAPGNLPIDNWNPVGADQQWREDRTTQVLGWLAGYEGPNWWNGQPGSMPDLQQLIAWLLYQEGSIYRGNHAVMELMVRIIYTRLGENPTVKGLSGFTAFFNPNGDDHFNQQDWEELVLLIDQEYPVDIRPYEQIVSNVFETDKFPDAPYEAQGQVLYWWETWEAPDTNSKMVYLTIPKGAKNSLYFGTYLQAQQAGFID